MFFFLPNDKLNKTLSLCLQFFHKFHCMTIHLRFVCFFLCLAFISCRNDNIIVDVEQSVDTFWEYNKPLEYSFEIQDTSCAYDMSIHIRHCATFTHENLYLNTTTIFPNGKTTTYPVSFQLAENNGKWLGKCSGDICDITIEMSSASYFQIPGKYTIQFEQFSRSDSLQGVQKIGLKVKKTAINN